MRLHSQQQQQHDGRGFDDAIRESSSLCPRRAPLGELSGLWRWINASPSVAKCRRDIKRENTLLVVRTQTIGRRRARTEAPTSVGGFFMHPRIRAARIHASEAASDEQAARPPSPAQESLTGGETNDAARPGKTLNCVERNPSRGVRRFQRRVVLSMTVFRPVLQKAATGKTVPTPGISPAQPQTGAK
jgi:hypothetical protein